MSLSCCGTNCQDCPAYPAECEGCAALKGRPAWVRESGGAACPFYACCVEGKGLKTCGQCAGMPCGLFEQTRDPSLSDQAFEAELRARVRALKQQATAQDLRSIPGVGENIAADLANIGIRCVDDLIGKDPEELYRQDCAQKGMTEDRCQLYVFRLAVYFAETEQPEKEKLKWWNWKDKPASG